VSIAFGLTEFNDPLGCQRTPNALLQFNSFNVILASVSLFLLLASVSPQNLTTRHPKISLVLKVISVNTLGIFLIHYIPMMLLQRGYIFGLQLSMSNPAVPIMIEIPLLAILCLLISLAIIIPAKKVPYLKKIMG
jgi:surface polysaccharide O-acyltransferase-like enzyme